MFALVGALFGAGASVYSGSVASANANKLLKAQQQQAVSDHAELVSLIEIVGASVALFSIAYLIVKKS